MPLPHSVRYVGFADNNPQTRICVECTDENPDLAQYKAAVLWNSMLAQDVDMAAKIGVPIVTLGMKPISQEEQAEKLRKLRGMSDEDLRQLGATSAGILRIRNAHC